MKPFVAISGVLDYLFAIFFRCISVENCAQTENLYCAHSSAMLLSESAPNAQTSISVLAQSSTEMPPLLRVAHSIGIATNGFMVQAYQVPDANKVHRHVALL